MRAAFENYETITRWSTYQCDYEMSASLLHTTHTRFV